MKWLDRSSVAVSFTSMVCASIEPIASGGWLATVTANVCVAASPSVSVAVTVTEASPLATAVTVKSLPSTEVPISVASDDATAKVSASPSGSSK